MCWAAYVQGWSSGAMLNVFELMLISAFPAKTASANNRGNGMKIPSVSPSMRNSFGGPCSPIQISVIAAINVAVSLFRTSFAACHLIHLQIMWNMIFFWKKHKSASTCSLNLVDRDDVATGCDCGKVQVLHISQVATISSTSLMTSGG